MENEIYQEIELQELQPNPLNPRKRFSGAKFNELVASIREKGVIEPILVRPVGDDRLEIVFGERRYRASLALAETGGGLNGQKIPALVRELSDEDAFDMMCIENLHREDLTELEEAEGFKAYLDKRGADALPDLAERAGINPRYIRRRVAVLSLPKKTLKAWEKGDLKYGHLEQLSRLQDKKEIKGLTEKIANWRGGYSVRKLKDDINSEAPELKSARFNLEKTGCPSCAQNSDIQKSLFELTDLKGAHCLNPKCFKKMQNNWLTANWKKTGYRKLHRTNGFRFKGDVGWDDYGAFDGYSNHKPLKKCKECDSFVTLLSLDGRVDEGKACIGDKNCFNSSRRSSGATDGGDPGAAVNKRPAWHGEYFREKFYDEVLLERLQGQVTARVLLFALLKSNSDLHEWFGRKHGKWAKGDDDVDGYYSFHLRNREIWEMVSAMECVDAAEDLNDASILVIMQDQYDAKARRAIADTIGISLQEEWRITEEYLDKKTIAEIMKIGEDFKVFEQKAAQTFLYETLLKKRGKFKGCKKGELKRVFLESGVDLAGVVPDEILGSEADGDKD